jgi:hypothetical protein
MKQYKSYPEYIGYRQYGYGYGNVYGDGYGNGRGYGDGYGYGNVYGDGYGNGYVYGDGYGRGRGWNNYPLNQLTLNYN